MPLDTLDNTKKEPENCCARELYSQELLINIIQKKERELQDLRAFQQALPMKMTDRAEKVLRELLYSKYGV